MTATFTRRAPVLLLLALAAPLSAAGLQPPWVVSGGQWSHTREVIPMVRQGSETGTAVALCPEVGGTTGAWRAVVEPALGAAQVGMLALADESLTRGFVVTLCSRGTTPAGLALQSAAGDVLWEDRWTPWHWYQPYVLELVVEPERVRAQMLEADGKTLVSQGPWVDVPAEQTARAGALGLYTRDGIARFWGWETAAEPLSPVVDNAPNKLRMIHEENAPWCLIGPGDWLWTDTTHQRFRQRAVVERTTLLSAEQRGPEGTWECLITVHPGAGGAGLMFLADPGLNVGFNAWLGGEFGSGALMLYRQPAEALWSGPQGAWHYDTQYLVRGEVTGGKVRAQMLTPDGVTLIQESPWFDLTPQEQGRTGLVGNMTWLGTAEFASTDAGATAAPATPVAPGTLAGGWLLRGDGAWEQPAPGLLRQTGSPRRALALTPEVQGTAGTWACCVTPAQGATAGLAFQMDRDLGKGFLALLGPEGLRLEDMSGRVMWRDAKVKAEAGVEVLVEGEVMTDRVAVRLRSADGQLLSECPAVYVPETNNHRTGILGLVAEGGAAEFRDWGRR
jgi:hypothetical protein